MHERIRLLQVNVAGQPSGQLLHQSGFEYRYLQADPAQPVVGLLMPPTQLTWHDGALFPVMDPDNHLIELAVAGQASHIVSRNLRDLRQAEPGFPQLRMVSPEQFQKEIST